MKHLLNKTGVKPEEVGYLNAHATSTQIGDKAEMLAIRDVFGDCKNSLHISSTKVSDCLVVSCRVLLVIYLVLLVFWKQRSVCMLLRKVYYHPH